MMELEARCRFFAALGERPRYERDGVEMLQTLLRQTPEFANAVVTSADLLVTSAHADRMTTAE